MRMFAPASGPLVRLAVVIAAAALAMTLAPVATAAPYVIEHAGRSSEVPARLLARHEMLDLESTAAFFDLAVRRDRKRIEVVGPRGRITLQIGRSTAQVGGEPMLLSTEVDVDRGRILVPVDFVTRGVARLLDAEARHDAAARFIVLTPRSTAVSCESFDDRTRVTIRLGKRVPRPDVGADGDRRTIVLRGVELPASRPSCPSESAVASLEVEPGGGSTRIAVTPGPRFGGIEIQEVAAENLLIIDVLLRGSVEEIAAVEAPPPPPTVDETFDTVVIDAGHGGEDRGAVGPSGVAEKDVVLGVAQALARRLRDRGLRVVLTRSSDVALPLVDRTQIANRERADLFISLHANASPAGPAWGAETYFLHLDATDEAARNLAAFESDATGLRARGASGEMLEMLLWDMAQQQYLEESSRLADTVQRELNELLGTRDRGVKQANFLVLRGATMPAVLIELGFLSNPTEERKLRQADVQANMAEAIARAVFAFRDQRDARTGP